MKNSENTKKLVKEKYGEIARKASQKSGCDCGCSSEPDRDYSVFSDSYQNMKGYVAEADLGLGCGLPTEFAAIKAGDTVVDLGSGAGNDVFIARRLAGDSGRVIGIDMTPEMILKAQENNRKLGYQNVDFRLGEIEKLPVPDQTAEVVISNCVLNLVPDKKKAFQEVFRILKEGGHFCISDVVIKGNLPEKLQESAEMYAGCVAGALQQDNYLEIINQTGFTDVEIKKSKQIELPDEVLREFLSGKEITDFRKSGTGIFSITVTGYKS
ncbi:MAG: arsenite S-adenosylmethyltransferase [Caldithrix sp. RBG_13_44_9]|nr:MAG: arsenite S-adenosylmethyltransferase [Caldithrix sp. RBG_13_44_9]